MRLLCYCEELHTGVFVYSSPPLYHFRPAELHLVQRCVVPGIRHGDFLTRDNVLDVTPNSREELLKTV